MLPQATTTPTSPIEPAASKIALHAIKGSTEHHHHHHHHQQQQQQSQQTGWLNHICNVKQTNQQANKTSHPGFTSTHV
jgi:hypothetical protein